MNYLDGIGTMIVSFCILSALAGAALVGLVWLIVHLVS